MRIDSDSPEARRVKMVLVNGLLVSGVVAFDVDEGWVEHYARDDDGELMVEGDSLVVRRVGGTVKVVWRE